MNKGKVSKGQAALEYLMNYGWAILVLAIVIGAIFATGVFNPNYLVVEECYLSSSFKCNSYLTNTGLLHLNLTNTLGYPVKIKSVSFSADEGATNISQNMGIKLNNTDSLYRQFERVTAPAQIGTVKKIKISLNYYICAEEVNLPCEENIQFLRNITGRIVTQVGGPIQSK